MKRFAATVFLIVFCSPVLAKDITITLNDQEQAALSSLLDQAVKYGGIQSAMLAVDLIRLIQQQIASQNSQSVPPPNTENSSVPPSDKP